MEVSDVALIAGFVAMFGLVSGLVDRSILTGPMLFVGFGLLLGSPGLDVLDLPLDDEGVHLLTETTLGLVLFSDAVRIDVARLRTEYSLPLRMLAVGLPLAIAIGTGFGFFVLDQPVAVAALIAAILAPTDAALGQAVVESRVVPLRIRQSLNVESGLNDGIALPAVTVFAAIVVSEEGFLDAGSWVRFAIEQIGYGLAVGAVVGLVGGRLIHRCSERGWMDGTFRQIAVLAVAVLAYVLSVGAGGNGFIATFVAGLVFGVTARATVTHVEEFTEDVAQLLAMITFIVFGAIVVGPSLAQIDWRIAVYAAASLLVVRPLAVALSLAGSHLRWPTVVFCGWFGPRGLASILFSLSVAADLGEESPEIVSVVVAWTVLASVVGHGLTATPGAAVYGRWWDRVGHDAMPESMPMEHLRVRHRPQSTE